MLERALYTAKIISYAQGFELMRRQSASSGWQLNLGQIALVWRAGCIIRSGFLERVKDAYQREPRLSNLMEDLYFQTCLTRTSQRCGRSYVWQPVQVFVLLPFPVLWRIMMDFIQHGFPQTCCKHKEIILGPIRCSELTEIHRNIFTIDGKN